MRDSASASFVFPLCVTMPLRALLPHQVFSSPLSCCNYLYQSGNINPANGILGTGLCSRSGTDPGFKKVRAGRVSGSTWCVLVRTVDEQSYCVSMVMHVMAIPSP
jgi:hypothetical protein